MPNQIDTQNDSNNKGDAKAANWLLKASDERHPPPRLKLNENDDDGPLLSFEGDNDVIRLHASMGLRNSSAVSFLLSQLSLMFEDSIRGGSAEKINQAISMLDELEPKGGGESMLAAQMVAIHGAAMTCLSRANLSGQSFEGRDLNLRHAERLTRIYAQHFETLAKNRRNGQQKVIVKHVHVNEGGQAIVGNVNHGGLNEK